MIIPMFSCGCLNSELWGARAESTRHAFCTRLGAVGHRCWPRPSRARDLARGARGKSIRCAGSAIAAGLHSPIRPHGPNAILQVAFTVVGHSPPLALAPGSLAPHLAELCVLHLDRALVVVPIVVLPVLLVPAAGVAVAAALHARIALHVPGACLQVALVVVGHGPTRALVAPAHTAQALASFSVGVADRVTVVAAPVVVLVPGAPAVVRRSRAEALEQTASRRIAGSGVHILRGRQGCRGLLSLSGQRQGCRGLLAIGGALLAANNLLTLITVAACQGSHAVHRVIARLAWRRARVWVLTLFASDNLRAHRISAACQRRLSINRGLARIALGRACLGEQGGVCCVATELPSGRPRVRRRRCREADQQHRTRHAVAAGPVASRTQTERESITATWSP